MERLSEKLKSVKRKHTDKHPETKISTSQKHRDEMIEFVHSGNMHRRSSQEIEEYCNKMRETKGSRPSPRYFEKSRFFKKVKIGENTYYRLSKDGLNTYKKHLSTSEEYSTGANTPGVGPVTLPTHSDGWANVGIGIQDETSAEIHRKLYKHLRNERKRRFQPKDLK